jgi:hypothetical protein
MTKKKVDNTTTPEQHLTEMKDRVHYSVDHILPTIHEEVDRLFRTNAIPEGAFANVVLRIALENVAQCYAVNGPAKDVYDNLKKF